MFHKLRTFWKVTLPILVAVGLLAGLYQDLFNPIYEWAFPDEVIEQQAGETILHIVPEEVAINVSTMSDSGFPDFYQTELIIQARKHPILLSNKVKLVSQEFNEDYFSEDITHYDNNFEILKISSDRISIERIGDVAKIKLLIKPMFVFPDTSCIVYGRCKNEIVGKIVLEVYYTYGGSEFSSIVEVPIRFI